VSLAGRDAMKLGFRAIVIGADLAGIGGVELCDLV
jgi:hypothetical protein